MGEVLGWLGQQLLQVVLPTLATAIAGLLVGLLTKYLKKINLEVTIEQEERLRKIVEDAVKATEEAARRATMSSAHKDDLAQRIVRTQVPDIPPHKLRVAIDAALPEVRKQLAPVPSTPATFGRKPD